MYLRFACRSKILIYSVSVPVPAVINDISRQRNPVPERNKAFRNHRPDLNRRPAALPSAAWRERHEERQRRCITNLFVSSRSHTRIFIIFQTPAFNAGVLLWSYWPDLNRRPAALPSAAWRERHEERSDEYYESVRKQREINKTPLMRCF